MKMANLFVSIVSVSYALVSFVMSNAITLTEGMTTELTNISASNISASNISEKMEFLNRVLRWIGWNYMHWYKWNTNLMSFPKDIFTSMFSKPGLLYSKQEEERKGIFKSTGD